MGARNLIFHFTNRRGEMLFGERNHYCRSFKQGLKAALKLATYYWESAKITGEPRAVSVGCRDKILYDFGHPHFFIGFIKNKDAGKYFENTRIKRNTL